MCRIFGRALKAGMTAATAEWICNLAKELRVPEGRLFKALKRLAQHGIWLTEDDWLEAARVLDLKESLERVVDYIVRRVKSGASVEEAVRELGAAAAKAGKLQHVLDVLRELV